MATVAELVVQIGGDSSGLRKEIAASQRQLKKGFGVDALAMSGAASDLLIGLAAAAGLAGGAAVKMSSDYAASKTAFTTLLGSAAAAEKMMQDLATFAADTPFELPGVIKASQMLLAFKFSAEDIIPIMSAVGNAIALVGGGDEAIDGVVRALGQIQAKGKLSAEEMNQLAERGINGWQYLASEMGVSVAAVMKMTQDGAIDSTTAINAVVSGMQENFAGGMDAMSKTVPGLMSTIKDNTGLLLKEIGDQIIDGLDLKGRLTDVTTFLNNFTALVKSSGVKAAIQELIPAETTAGVYAFAGALTGAAVPAMTAFGFATWAALAPLAPFIALGATVGLMAYEIWNNWEPLSELFSSLWDSVLSTASECWDAVTGVLSSAWTYISGIVDSGVESVSSVTSGTWAAVTSYVGEAWDEIKSVVASGVDWVLGKLQSMLAYIKSIVPDSVSNMFTSLGSTFDNYKASADGSSDSTNANPVWGKFHWGNKTSDATTNNDTPPPEKPNTEFTGLHNAPMSSDGGGKAGKAGKEKKDESGEKLANEAKRITKEINKEWTDLTGTKLDSLDNWYQEELKKLNESASANADYESDVTRLNEVYALKRQKIIAQEKWDKIDAFNQIANTWEATQKELTLGALTGSAKEETSAAFDTLSKIKTVESDYQKIMQNYEEGTNTQKANIIAALDAVGIKYTTTAQGTLDFTKQIADDRSKYVQQKNQEDLNNYQTCKDIQQDIDAAYTANSMAMLQQALTDENAERQNNYDAQKDMMDTWQAVMLAANETTAQLISDLYSSGFTGVQTAISDILTGTTSIGDAVKSLGKTLLKTIADWVAKWIAGQLMMSIFGKSTMAAQTAASVAAAAITAKAWAKAAAMVSLASWGANGVPATAAIIATTSVAEGLATVPGLATGGVTTGPTLALIGEGRYKEAVVPLEKGLFAKLMDGGSAKSATENAGTGAKISTIFTNYGDINNGSDLDELYNGVNTAVLTGLRGV